jgi:hypothetical protein
MSYMKTYRVVIAPKGYGPDDQFANQFFLRTMTVMASNRDDAIMKAAIQSHVAEYECGDFTVRSVDVVTEVEV